MKTYIFQIVKFIIEVNFYISMMLFIVSGFLSIFSNYVIFEFNEDLYGVMALNLKMMMMFLALSELLLCVYCFIVVNRRMFVFVGFFLILLMASLPFYAQINTVEIDPNLYWFFLYVSISHIAFGLYAFLEAKHKL